MPKAPVPRTRPLAALVLLMAVAALANARPLAPAALPAIGAPAPARLSALGSGARLNLACARADELELLPRIGPMLARRLIEYRARQGLPAHLEELRAVPGIGPRTIERLRPLVFLPPDGKCSQH